MTMKRLIGCLLILAAVSVLLVPFQGRASAAEKKITVAGASDLSFAFREMASEFEKETGYRVVLSLGSTGMLARQIEQGAPFDAFFAADMAYVKALRKSGHIKPGTVELYAEGRLALAVKRGSGVKAASLNDLASGRITRIAIANPQHAPYGRAAEEALKSAGLWHQVKDRLVYGENIRQALQFVESGNAEAGIIALSVARSPGIEFVEVPANLHRPIRQAVGVLSASKEPEAAAAFIKFVNSYKGYYILKRYGFIPLGNMPGTWLDEMDEK